jgi:hypothetical protein
VKRFVVVALLAAVLVVPAQADAHMLTKKRAGKATERAVGTYAETNMPPWGTYWESAPVPYPYRQFCRQRKEHAVWCRANWTWVAGYPDQRYRVCRATVRVHFRGPTTRAVKTHMRSVRCRTYGD